MKNCVKKSNFQYFSFKNDQKRPLKRLKGLNDLHIRCFITGCKLQNESVIIIRLPKKCSKNEKKKNSNKKRQRKLINK